MDDPKNRKYTVEKLVVGGPKTLNEQSKRLEVDGTKIKNERSKEPGLKDSMPV